VATAGTDGGGIVHGVVDSAGSSRFVRWDGFLSPEGFHHVVVVYDGKATSVWLDSRLVATKTEPGPAPDVGLLTWGCRIITSGPVNCLDGWLDEAAIYDHPLSEARVRAHFEAGTAH
jgi:hypothetical protein